MSSFDTQGSTRSKKVRIRDTPEFCTESTMSRRRELARQDVQIIFLIITLSFV